MGRGRLSPRIVGYSVAMLAVIAGLWLMRENPLRIGGDIFGRFSLSALNPFDQGRPVALTGLDRGGRVEVPVINLWEHPGFVRSNQVVGRVVLADGIAAADLLAERQTDGLTWNEVRVGDARGWVLKRFVIE